MAKLSPIESEFASTEEAEAYDAWFRARVEKALAYKGPGIPHDEAMTELKRRMEERRRARGSLDG